MEPLILTFDIGTQSVRAILAQKDGNFLDKEQYTYEEPYLSAEPFFAEQTPNFYYDALCRVSKAILGRNPDALKSIIGVTVTTIRDTVLCLDKDNEPLGNIIVWLDKREAAYEPEKVPAAYRALFKLVGMSDTIEYQYRDSKCNWIMQKDPERWENTASYVYLSGYINYLLSGELVDSVGSTIGHMPFDSKKRAWMGKSGLTYSVYAIPEAKLFPVKEPGETLGRITEKASAETLIPAGLPIIATGSDKGCETIGLSVTRPGSAAISFGTSSTMQITCDKYVEPQPFMPAYPAAIPGRYNPEIQIYRGYWMLTWFINEFCHEEKKLAEAEGICTEEYLDRYLEQVPPGSGGLLVQPYWTPGVATPNARGSMVGFNDRQTKYHLYRAIIEGINFELMCAKKMLEKQSKTEITELYAAGGGARSPEILQITADMFGIPIKRIQTHEATGLGSSLVAFTALGEFADYDEAAKAMIRTETVYTPDPEAHALYQDLFAVYEKLYGNLKKTYAKEKMIYRRRGHV